MMTFRRCLLLGLLPIVACGEVQALATDGATDQPPPGAGPTIQITGTVREIGTQDAAGGATIDVIQISDRALLATTRSDAAGRYSVDVPTHGALVEAYLDVRDASHLRSHTYLVPRLGSSSIADVLVISGPSLQQLASAANVQQPASTGFILVQLFESNLPATGATAAVTPPRPACYTEPTTHQPRCTRTATADDGLVWMFAVPPGTAALRGWLADMIVVGTRQISVEANMLIQIGLEP
jgi:hypothetical protein